MRTSAGHYAFACFVIVLAAALAYLCWDAWTAPPDPEGTLNAIVDGDITKISLLYRDDFPIEVLIDHVQDDRSLRRPVYATRGPNQAWMVCHRALQARLGLAPDLNLAMKWWLPVPEFFDDRAGFREWWDGSSKDEVLIRHEMASWQLAQMEKSPDQFKVHLPFKRQQVAETKRQLDAR